MVGLHDLFSEVALRHLDWGRASGSVSQSGGTWKSHATNPRLPKSSRHPPWAEAL